MLDIVDFFPTFSNNEIRMVVWELVAEHKVELTRDRYFRALV